MNCEELRQNTAAYVLGALSESEETEFARHVSECGLEHEVDSFNEVVSRLSGAAPAMDPPAGLRDRILAAAKADSSAGGQGSSPLPSTEPGPATGRGRERNFGIQRFGAAAYAAAAMLLIVIGAVIGWVATTQFGGDDPVQLSHFRRDPGGEWLRVEGELGEAGTTLSVGNLDTLTEQRIYQFWAIRDEAWIDVGEFNTNPEGRWSGEFDFALEQGDSIAITVEPEGGSEKPTSDPEIQSRI